MQSQVIAEYDEYKVEDQGGMYSVIQDDIEFAFATTEETAKQIALLQALLDRDDFVGRHLRELISQVEVNEEYWASSSTG